MKGMKPGELFQAHYFEHDGHELQVMVPFIEPRDLAIKILSDKVQHFEELIRELQRKVYALENK